MTTSADGSNVFPPAQDQGIAEQANRFSLNSFQSGTPDNNCKIGLNMESHNFPALDHCILGFRNSTNLQYRYWPYSKQDFSTACGTSQVATPTTKADVACKDHVEQPTLDCGVSMGHPDIDKGWAWVVVGSSFCAFAILLGKQRAALQFALNRGLVL